MILETAWNRRATRWNGYDGLIAFNTIAGIMKGHVCTGDRDVLVEDSASIFCKGACAGFTGWIRLPAVRLLPDLDQWRLPADHKASYNPRE